MKYILRHKLLLVLVVLLLIGFIWYGSGDESSSPLTTEDTDVNNPSREIVTKLLALQVVTLTGTIFSDPAFKGLKDFSTQIIPEEMGRPDPFAPLGRSADAAAVGAARP
ncbi:MAG TPA: hypothetical protein VJH69_02250 [Candidatus Paceibacterota bacterium]